MTVSFQRQGDGRMPQHLTHDLGMDAFGQQEGRGVVEQFRPSYPATMRSLTEDLEASLAHLKLPAVHRKSLRTTNLIARSSAEERRAKVIPPKPGGEGLSEAAIGVFWRTSER